MKKRVAFIVLLAVLITFLSLLKCVSAGSSDLISASTINSEIQKATHYAEEYEIGNINYVKLLVYISESRQNMNEILGASEKEMGGVLKQEKIREILGEPSEETKWVWVEGEDQDKKLDYSVPVWKKIIFDGRKIQISLDAFPSIFSKKQIEEQSDGGNGENKETENSGSSIKEGDLIYRLNFWIQFKKSEEQMDIAGKIDEIKSLAETFNSNPSRANAEALAMESVNAEKKFESYFRQSSEKCEDLMASIFGSESKMPSQSMIVQEISFYEGERFEVIARLEMCDECESNWINLDMWVEMRGPMPKMDESGGMIPREEFKNKDDEFYKSEIVNLLDLYKKAADEKNWKEANSIKQKLWMINEAWNQKANDVWKELDEKYKDKFQLMSQQEQEEFNRNYGWIKQDQERRKEERELRKKNYEERKQFYLNLFSGYDKKEYSFDQIEFKKRLIELFMEKGEEICDNNLDDNKNEKIDCDDDLCSGKICGRGTTELIGENETKNIEVDFYCIAGECKAKEQVSEIKESVCGNHVCEGNETETCKEDCTSCLTYEAINCSGKVIFKGKDENGCPLQPVCIEEEICEANEDCKFLCGVGACVEGKCQVKELSECSEKECNDGTQKTINCDSGESIISGICENGLWKDTGFSCPEVIAGEIGEEVEEVAKEEQIIEGEVVGDACSTIADCGRENDVCSNGKCIAIPEAVEIEEAEEQESSEQGESSEEQTQESSEQNEKSSSEEKAEEQEEQSQAEETGTITGNIISSIKTITGFVIGITGLEVKGDSENADSGDTGSDGGGVEEGQQEGDGQETQQQGEQSQKSPREEQRTEEYQGRDEDGKEERRQEDEKRQQENRERCREECNRPCIEKCIREACGENMECNIDEESKKCEEQCSPDESCIEKCMKGEGEWWKEFENKEEFKEQKGGFEAGGSCRKAKGKTEGFIWFGGWGDPFGEIQQLKNKYYSGGNAEWCKFELESLIKQREEFEKGFNTEFAKWFFESYLANSAENWESAVSGIFELYWKNVDNQREMAFRMKCLDETDINKVMSYNLITLNYETDYGKIEYWEEIKPVKIPGMEGETTIISPYMKVWVFPSKEFIVYEMKESMKNHEFPGSPEQKMERKNEEGPTAEEKERIKQDKKLMETITKIAEKYDGSVDVDVQVKDFSKNEIVFNLYAQVNEDEIIKIIPMLPEEITSKDITVEIDFEKIYNLIYSQEKEMNGERIESPPWDRKAQPIQRIKEIANGVKMYFKIRDIMNSAKITPDEAEKDVKNLFKSFMSIMKNGGKNNEVGGMGEGPEEGEKNIDLAGEEKGVWEEKGKITGEVIA